MEQASIILATVSKTSELLPALFFFVLTFLALVLSCVFFTINAPHKKSNKMLLLGTLYVVTLTVLVCMILCFVKFGSLNKAIKANNKQLNFSENPSISQEFL